MGRRWKVLWRVVCWGSVSVAGLLAVLAWRLHALPAEESQALVRALGAEHAAMWASVWGPLPVSPESTQVESFESMGWGLLPRPQVHLNGVRLSVPQEVSADRQLRVERLSVALQWRSLWRGIPTLHDVHARGLSGSSNHAGWGLHGDWRVHDMWLGPADEQGVRDVSWTVDAELRPLRTATDGIDPHTPWLAGQWRGRASWLPAVGETPAQWRDVDMRFAGQLAGRAVQSSRLTLARWQHQAAQRRLILEGLALRAQWGEGKEAADIAFESPTLDLGPDHATGAALKGEWTSAAPLSLHWAVESAPPRGRYGALVWPQWRAVLSGRNGTRAGGQLQADLHWLPDRQGWRWDALMGEVSVQPRGEAERQWSLRGRLDLGLQGAAWQLEGQAHGGAPDAILWDGPFATEGAWTRWPQPQARASLRVASLWPQRWHNASRSIAWPPLWSRLDTWPGQVHVQVGQLNWKGLRLAGAEADLINREGVIRLQGMSARTWDGRLQAEGEWRLADSQWRIDARVQDADLRRLRQTLDADQPRTLPAQSRFEDMDVPTRWGGRLVLTGQDQDARTWQGDWALDARAGQWAGVDIRAARQGANEVWRIPEPDARSEWRRLTAQGRVTDGVASIDRANVLTASGRASVAGHIALTTGDVDLTWHDGAGARKRGQSLSLSGPWRAPRTRALMPSTSP